ncbi:MAG: hypothetical protein AB1781_11165 [Pseudomonadota bacterium]
MQLDQLLTPIRQALGYIGLALAVVALAKFFGVGIQAFGRGDTATTAMVAIACLLSR